METVIMHHRDMDGIVSALIAKEQFPDAQLISTNYGEGNLVFSTFGGKRVIMVDFSLDIQQMQDIRAHAKHFIWIDHHKSASKLSIWSDKSIEGLREIDGPAGCELAWKFFNPDKEIPYGVELVGDRDTWTFKHGLDTKAFHESLQTFDIDLHSGHIKTIVFGAHDVIHQTIAKGCALLEYKEALVARLYKKGHIEQWKGHRCFVGNTNTFVSDLASYAFRHDPSVEIARIKQTKWAGKNWIIENSLRSQGNVDVSKIAESYGGGGHHNASGFVVKLVPL